MDAAETPSPGAAVVAVLTRAPSAGGKTRLFAALGRPPDPDLAAALLLDTLDAIQSPAWTRVVFVEPAAACDEVRALVPAGVRVRPQRGGDLGDRMRAAMDDAFADGAAAVAILGSDLPDVDPRAIADAFAALARDREAVAIGPARDGGYYLIGATRTPDVFSGIAWGGPDVREKTVAAAVRRGRPVTFVAETSDVDTVEDLRRLARRSPAGSARARRTRAWLERYPARWKEDRND